MGTSTDELATEKNQPLDDCDIPALHEIFEKELKARFKRGGTMKTMVRGLDSQKSGMLYYAENNGSQRPRVASVEWGHCVSLVNIS